MGLDIYFNMHLLDNANQKMPLFPNIAQTFEFMVVFSDYLTPGIPSHRM
jgi:hypothetical protein